MPSTLIIVLGISVSGTGIALAIFASLKAAKIRDYVVKNELAPNLTKSYYFQRFYFPAVCAAYVKATGDRAGVWLVNATGILGMLLAVGGCLLAESQLLI